MQAGPWELAREGSGPATQEAGGEGGTHRLLLLV